MRIVAGKYRHRNIIYPENNPNIRPTKDRIREAIFSALNNIEDKICVDLYAGSGAIGLEAISRGAKKVYFNDISNASINVVKENIKSLKIENEYYNISLSDDFSFLNSLNEKVDIFFIDPPYQKGEYNKLLKYIKDKDLLNENGIIVVENNINFDIDNSYFQKIKTYHYGKINVIILWR